VLLRNFLVGFYGFAAFCFVLALCLESLGGPAAFSAALAAALAVQAIVWVLRSRRLRPRPAGG
jgi:Flp pilus assembly protein TadB